MSVSKYTTQTLAPARSRLWIRQTQTPMSAVTAARYPAQHPAFDPLQPLRQWLDGIKICDAKFARLLCRLIPAQCPFERDITLFGKVLFHIPPMCKLNPLYEQFVGLRFRALCYLADQCGEDVTPYC